MHITFKIYFTIQALTLNLLDAFSDDFAANNDDTPYRSISLRFSVASQLDAMPHKLLVGACTFLHEWLSLFSNLFNFA
jgi:hypothetical protein